MRKEVLGIFFNVLAAVNLSQQVHGESIIYSKIKPWRSVFEDFAESVKLLPKADVITASDLKHNLFEPYLETLKLKDDFL